MAQDQAYVMDSKRSAADVRHDPEGRGFELRAIRCPTCEVDDAKVVGSRGGKYHRYGLGLPTTIVRCRRCGLLYPNPFPFPLNSQELYGDPDKYFAHLESEPKVAYGRDIVQGAQKRLGRLPRSLLDVGSGRGELLFAAQERGVPEVVGLELSDAMVRNAAERYGVQVKRHTIEEFASQTEQRFEAIVLNAVLEHVHDPNSMIAAVRSLTEPGSLLYLDLPNEPHLTSRVGNALNRITGSPAVYNLSPTFPPYHVFGFNPRALKILLAKHSFDILSVRVYASPFIPARSGFDRVKARVGEQIMRLANATRTASNMMAWARRRSD